jgi:hypothetical protein
MTRVVTTTAVNPKARAEKQVTFSSVTSTIAADAIELKGDFNLSITDVSTSGTWSGSVSLNRSFDGGTTWIARSTYSAATDVVLTEPELGVKYVTASVTQTAGSVRTKISQ